MAIRDLFNHWPKDDYCMTPFKAKQLIQHLQRVYSFTQTDIYYLTGISKQVLSWILNDKLIDLPRKEADKLVNFYKSLWWNDFKFFRAQNDWLQKLVYYLTRWELQSAKQKKYKSIMLAHRDEWEEKECTILDLVDLNKMKTWERFYYNEKFLEWILDPNYKYYRVRLKLPKSNQQLANKCLKLFIRNFNEFPSDLYNKYLWINLKYEPKNQLLPPAEKRIELEKIKHFLFCF